MKLYYSPGACSLAPHIVAREAGIPLDLEKVDLVNHKLADGSNYYDVNPRGYVPAIRVADGAPVLTEANVVVQFLADQKPEAGLMPKAGTPERSHGSGTRTRRPRPRRRSRRSSIRASPSSTSTSPAMTIFSARISRPPTPMPSPSSTG
jgi:hypothetical protein